MDKSAPRALSTSDGDSVVTSVTLLNELTAGSNDAWTEFVLKYRPWLMKNCRRAGLSEDDAENVIQEVLLTLHRRIGQFDRARRGSFRRWLRLVLRSRVVDFFRAVSKHRDELAIAAACQPKPGRSRQKAEVDLTVEKKLRFSEAMKVIRAEFSDRDFEILMRYLAYGQSAESIADELGITPNVVYLTRSRILQRVRMAIAIFDDE